MSLQRCGFPTSVAGVVVATGTTAALLAATLVATAPCRFSFGDLVSATTLSAGVGASLGTGGGTLQVPASGPLDSITVSATTVSPDIVVTASAASDVVVTSEISDPGKDLLKESAESAPQTPPPARNVPRPPSPYLCDQQDPDLRILMSKIRAPEHLVKSPKTNLVAQPYTAFLQSLVQLFGQNHPNETFNLLFRIFVTYFNFFKLKCAPIAYLTVSAKFHQFIIYDLDLAVHHLMVIPRKTWDQANGLI